MDKALHSRNEFVVWVGNHVVMDNGNPHTSRQLDAATGLVFGVLLGVVTWVAGAAALWGLAELVGW